MTSENPTCDWIPFFVPPIGDADISGVVDTLKSGWITRGPRTQEFERTFAESVGAEAALALSSCTAALHLSLIVNGIGPGDEVITTTMTFCATANVIEHVGATPVLVDVEEDTLNIDPAAVLRAITPHTKAIIVVHYAGHPVDLDALQAIARNHNLAFIQDAAHAFPAAFRGRRVGGDGDLTCFSFYANKNLAIGEGGMLTGPVDKVETARRFSLHGMNTTAWNRFTKAGSWRYDVNVAGFKCNMTDIQASIGLSQLCRVAVHQKRRAEIFKRYDRAFSNSWAVRPLRRRSEVDSSLHLYVIRLNLEYLSIDRDEFIEELKARNVATSVHYVPIHMHSHYANKFGFRPEDFPVALDYFNRTISLPLFPTMTDDQIDRVAETVLAIAAEHRA
jgi:dTDP-4-amino-4,6-dideoxygalactose transaminase